MRTNIDIDDRLMRQAMRASGGKTKRGVVDEALKLRVQTRSQAGIRKLRGPMRWVGDLEASRASRSAEPPRRLEWPKSLRMSQVLEPVKTSRPAERGKADNGTSEARGDMLGGLTRASLVVVIVDTTVWTTAG